MLDPCSIGTYITGGAAEELQLTGEIQNLTILGTGGTEIKRQSKRVRCSVGSMNGSFSAQVEADVLACHDWPHLTSTAFDRVSNRKQIDMLIGSDPPSFPQSFTGS